MTANNDGSVIVVRQKDLRTDRRGVSVQSPRIVAGMQINQPNEAGYPCRCNIEYQPSGNAITVSARAI